MRGETKRFGPNEETKGTKTEGILKTILARIRSFDVTYRYFLQLNNSITIKNHVSFEQYRVVEKNALPVVTLAYNLAGGR